MPKSKNIKHKKTNSFGIRKEKRAKEEIQKKMQKRESEPYRFKTLRQTLQDYMD